MELTGDTCSVAGLAASSTAGFLSAAAAGASDFGALAVLLVDAAPAARDSVFGLEVVLLASPFSTADEAVVELAEDFDDEDVVTVLVTEVVLRVVLLTVVGTAAADLMVGVTVAEGFVEMSLCL